MPLPGECLCPAGLGCCRPCCQHCRPLHRRMRPARSKVRQRQRNYWRDLMAPSWAFCDHGPDLYGSFSYDFLLNFICIGRCQVLAIAAPSFCSVMRLLQVSAPHAFAVAQAQPQGHVHIQDAAAMPLGAPRPTGFSGDGKPVSTCSKPDPHARLEAKREADLGGQVHDESPSHGFSDFGDVACWTGASALGVCGLCGVHAPITEDFHGFLPCCLTRCSSLCTAHSTASPSGQRCIRPADVSSINKVSPAH